MPRFKKKKKKKSSYNENIKIGVHVSQRGSCTVDYLRRNYMKLGMLYMLVSVSSRDICAV